VTDRPASEPSDGPGAAPVTGAGDHDRAPDRGRDAGDAGGNDTSPRRGRRAAGGTPHVAAPVARWVPEVAPDAAPELGPGARTDAREHLRAAKPRLPRYRTGDKHLDETIRQLVDTAGVEGARDLVFELVVSALRLGREHTSRADLKIANSALKELRYSFGVFGPYRDVRKVSIFGSARTAPDDPLYDLTRRFAASIIDHDWMVITGAGPGIMAAGIEGAGPDNAFGVSIRLPFEASANEFIAADRKLINFRYFFTRKVTFMRESSGFVLLPGGFGTMDELFELLTLVQTGKATPAPVVLLDEPGGTYWQSWMAFVEQQLLADRYINPVDLDLVRLTDDVDEAVEVLTRFYANYHSQRFVEGKLVLRLKVAPDDAMLADVSERYASMLVSGAIERVDPHPEELADDDEVDLARLRLHFDRRSWAKLIALLRELNALVP
jgi:uncharacterized protein (TIGR00730 family)